MSVGPEDRRRQSVDVPEPSRRSTEAPQTSHRSVDRPERSRQSVDRPESSLRSAGGVSRPPKVGPRLGDFLKNPGAVAQNYTYWLSGNNGGPVRVSILNGQEYSRGWFDALHNTDNPLPGEIVDLCMSWLRHKLLRNDCKVVHKWSQPNRKYIVPSQFFTLFYQHSTTVGWGSELQNYPSQDFLSYAHGDSDHNIPGWFDAYEFIIPGCIDGHWIALIVDLVQWTYILVGCDPQPDDVRVDQWRNHVTSLLTHNLYYYLIHIEYWDKNTMGLQFLGKKELEYRGKIHLMARDKKDSDIYTCMMIDNYICGYPTQAWADQPDAVRAYRKALGTMLFYFSHE